MSNFRLIDPKAFQFSSPQEQQLAQGLVGQGPTSNPQQPAKRMPIQQAKDVDDRFDTAFKLSQSGGLGGLAGGIATLALALADLKQEPLIILLRMSNWLVESLGLWGGLKRTCKSFRNGVHRVNFLTMWKS